MTVTDRFSGSALRFLAVLGAMAMTFALLPQTAGAQDPDAACPTSEAPPAADFTDRDEIPTVHRLNVDCAAAFNIVQGFADGTYRPSLQVRRDQMASFIANTLDAADIALPAGESNTFDDVPDGNVHSDNVNRLAAVGIVQGGPLGLGADDYGPGLFTRRDQMTSFLMRAAGYALHGDVNHFDSTAQQFSDVPAGNVHFTKVNAAAENDITLGTGGGLFSPSLETRRDQMASFVVRLLSFILDAQEPAPGLNLALDPAACEVGEPITTTATATATDGGSAGAGIEVTFDASIDGGATETTTATTDVAGEATSTYTPEEAGDLTITVTATVEGEEVTDSVTVTCAEPTASVTLALDPADCVVDEETTATATLTDADGAAVEAVDVDFATSDVATDPATGTDATDAAGEATFAFTPTEAGAVTVTVTAIVDGEEVTDSVTVTCSEPAVPDGPITLASTTVQRGSTLSGAVDDPGTVASITATGCGLSNETVGVSASGDITLHFPASTALGECELTFTVQRTDGSVETQTFTITVTDVAPALTEGPDLLSAQTEANLSPTHTNVIYTFDEDATGFASNPNDFHLYHADGTRFTADEANLVAGNPDQVRARFLTSQVNNSTVATVNIAAVTDAAGNINTWSGVPLTGFEFVAGITNAPDLESVDNLVRGATDPLIITADFRFDQPVDPATYAGNEQAFRLISRDNTTYFGIAGTGTNVTADNRTVRVAFQTLVTIPLGSIVRGVVDTGAVAGALAGPFNPLQAADIVDDGTNDAPSLVSATVVGPDQVDYVFSEPIDVGVTDAPDPDEFFVYGRGGAGTEVDADTAVRSTTDTHVVRATFPAGTIASAVGASVDCTVFTPGSPVPSECTDGAVFGNQNNRYNSQDEVPLQGLVFQAGRTALPDLVSVTAQVDQFNNTRVVFVFDSDLQATYGAVATAQDFALVDEFGTIFQPTADGVVSGRTATFDANQFGVDQVRDAVVGSVNDGAFDTGLETAPFGFAGPGAQPRFPENHVPVVPTTS